MTRDGLVAVDLSSSRWRPALYEVVQLIDDLPLVPVSDRGWKDRVRFAEKYLDVMDSLGIALKIDAESLYATFAVARSVFTISRPMMWEGNSRRMNRDLLLMFNHGKDLLAFVRRRYKGEPVGRLAKEIAGYLDPDHGDVTGRASGLSMDDRSGLAFRSCSQRSSDISLLWRESISMIKAGSLRIFLWMAYKRPE